MSSFSTVFNCQLVDPCLTCPTLLVLLAVDVHYKTYKIWNTYKYQVSLKESFALYEAVWFALLKAVAQATKTGTKISDIPPRTAQLIRLLRMFGTLIIQTAAVISTLQTTTYHSHAPWLRISTSLYTCSFVNSKLSFLQALALLNGFRAASCWLNVFVRRIGFFTSRMYMLAVRCFQQSRITDLFGWLFLFHWSDGVALSTCPIFSFLLEVFFISSGTCCMDLNSTQSDSSFSEPVHYTNSSIFPFLWRVSWIYSTTNSSFCWYDKCFRSCPVTPEIFVPKYIQSPSVCEFLFNRKQVFNSENILLLAFCHSIWPLSFWTRFELVFLLQNRLENEVSFRKVNIPNNGMVVVCVNRCFALFWCLFSASSGYVV